MPPYSAQQINERNKSLNILLGSGVIPLVAYVSWCGRVSPGSTTTSPMVRGHFTKVSDRPYDPDRQLLAKLRSNGAIPTIITEERHGQSATEMRVATGASSAAFLAGGLTGAQSRIQAIPIAKIFGRTLSDPGDLHGLTDRIDMLRHLTSGPFSVKPKEAVPGSSNLSTPHRSLLGNLLDHGTLVGVPKYNVHPELYPRYSLERDALANYRGPDLDKSTLATLSAIYRLASDRALRLEGFSAKTVLDSGLMTNGHTYPKGERRAGIMVGLATLAGKRILTTKKISEIKTHTVALCGVERVNLTELVDVLDAACDPTTEQCRQADTYVDGVFDPDTGEHRLKRLLRST